MGKSRLEKDFKFLKAIQFWEFRTKVLEYFQIYEYLITIQFTDGRTITTSIKLPNLNNEFEKRQFADWIFVICAKYKKKFLSIDLTNIDDEKIKTIRILIEEKRKLKG